MSHYMDLTHAFFAETFQPMNAAVTFQIGLNESARAIRGKFTFAGTWESCCRMRTEVIQTQYILLLSLQVQFSYDLATSF